MKIHDLDRNQIYDLRGITHEQAEELLQWLMINDTNWRKDHLEDLNGENLLYYCIGNGEWIPDYAGNRNKTTHISTLFEEPSYAVQLIEAVKRVEELKRKINEPKVGDFVKSWNDRESVYVVGILKEKIGDDFVTINGTERHHYYKSRYCKKLTQQEVIELLYGAN